MSAHCIRSPGPLRSRSEPSSRTEPARFRQSARTGPSESTRSRREGCRDGILRPMTLVDRIAGDLTAAMKSQDALRVGVLRMAKSAIKNKEIEKRSSLDDAETVRLLQSLVKQREESAEQFGKAGRQELADKERAEIEVLRAYLPREVGDAEIAAAVEAAMAETGATWMKDIGRVMKAALAALAGQAVDGKKVNEAVRKRLGG